MTHFQEFIFGSVTLLDAKYKCFQIIIFDDNNEQNANQT